MPTNCWNTDSRMPTQTIGSSPSARTLAGDAWDVGFLSLAIAVLDLDDVRLDVVVLRQRRGQHRLAPPSRSPFATR